MQRKLCAYKDVEITSAELAPTNVHILLSIPPKISVSSFMRYLKEKSTQMIVEKARKLEAQVIWKQVFI